MSVEENLLYTKLLVKLPPPKKLRNKKSWIDIAESTLNKFTDKMIATAAKKVCIY